MVSGTPAAGNDDALIGPDSYDDSPNGAVIALLVIGSLFLAGFALFVWIYRRRRLAQAHTTPKGDDVEGLEHSASRIDPDGEVLKRSVHDLKLTDSKETADATLSPSSAQTGAPAADTVIL